MSRTEHDPLLGTYRRQEKRGPETKSRWTQFRESNQLVVTVVFIAMMLDLIVLTSIDPLLPNILMQFDKHHDSLNSTSNSTMDNSTASNSSESYLAKDMVTNSTNANSTSASVESRVGVLIALKPGTEVFANVFVGALVAKVGHRGPMLCGFVFNTLSTLGFAYSPSYVFLIVARICQAVASSMSVVSGLALISCTFHDETKRSKAISSAFGGLSLGIVLGYPFGSVTYQFIGRRVPFIMLAVLSLLDGLFRMLIANPESGDVGTGSHREKRPTAYLQLLRDPCIIFALICNFAPNFALGVFLATGPAWMLNDLHGEQWEIGVILAIAMLFQILSQFITGIYSMRYGRWKFCMLGMWIYAAGMLIYPHCPNVWMVTFAEILTRSGFGIIICVISPLLSNLVDIRHDSNYGEVFGLYTASYNIALTIGPLVGGFLLNYVSFGTIYRSVSGFIFLVSFSCLVFRNPRPWHVVLTTVGVSDNDGHVTETDTTPRANDSLINEVIEDTMPPDNRRTTWYVREHSHPYKPTVQQIQPKV